MTSEEKIILAREISMSQEYCITEGVYLAVITEVKMLNNQRIQLKFKVTLDDNSHYTLYLRTNLVPKRPYDMINRLAQACRTRKPLEFIDSEVYISVVINKPTDFERYENIQDVMYCDDAEEFEYELSEKGYFIR